jgi:23S rRNA (uracil1939-C5)-methyltransferase
VKAVATRTEAGIDLDLRDARPLDLSGRMLAAAVAERFDLARLSWGGETLSARRPPVLRMGPVRVTPPPGAFLQATAEGEAALADAVAAILGEAGRVADLFAGIGTFALRLAASRPVHAVEGAADHAAALLAAARGTTGLRPVTAAVRDLFRRPLLPDELSGFDAAVIDPPRAGAAAQVAALARSRVGRIAHVSCNPATFAREAATLTAAGFRPGPVTVVDQFRWSAHVELVGGFTRG